ncbi:MAG TPA: dienelactone hydrolase family protein [Steroidobacteraceae bacterium]|nr:dienelactone hydrolase family protein [Steroidobacteraceae bacterium]
MGQKIRLTAGDGFHLDAYRADPAGPPRGGIVIIQEIFGVNAHIREVVDEYAAEGYLTVAPAFFDRIKPGVELGYDPPGIGKGRELMTELQPDRALLDIQAGIAAVTSAGKVGVVGYCWGGTMAYFAAAHTNIAAAVAYYGGRITQYLKDKPRCPIQYHFGELDKGIPSSMIQQIQEARPEGLFYLYKGADHGFNCSHRSSYEPKSAALAKERTLKFLREHVG